MKKVVSRLKKIVKKLVCPNYGDSITYVKYLRKGGAKIGEGTHFYAPCDKPVDETKLPFIEMGENCRVTAGVTILAHDYSYAVLRPLYHNMIGKAGVTKIGNNVFFGTNSIILMGTTIGNNVIIGAGAVVSGNIPDNVVVAGNPAKIVCTLEEYYQKTYSNIEEYARIFYARKKAFLKRDLTENEMGWWNQLWNTKGEAKKTYQSLRVDGDNKEQIVDDMLKIVPRYESFDEFKAKIGEEAKDDVLS